MMAGGLLLFYDKMVVLEDPGSNSKATLSSFDLINRAFPYYRVYAIYLR